MVASMEHVKIIIEPDGNSFHAYCPSLPGLHTCGNTEEEALSNVKDAIKAYVQSITKHGGKTLITYQNRDRMPKEISPPGSDSAIKMGCTCPVLDNEHGLGYMGIKGKYVMTKGCPLHDPDSKI